MTDRDEGRGAAEGTGPFDMAGSRMRVVARMGEGDGDTALIRSEMAPGKLVPLHAHGEPECFYVLSGRLEVFLDAPAPGWRAVEAGGSLLVAAGVRHAVRNGGEGPVDVVIATTVRMARFFRDAGRPAEPDSPVALPGPDDLARLARTAAAYGFTLATPAESAAVTG